MKLISIKTYAGAAYLCCVWLTFGYFFQSAVEICPTKGEKMGECFVLHSFASALEGFLWPVTWFFYTSYLAFS